MAGPGSEVAGAHPKEKLPPSDKGAKEIAADAGSAARKNLPRRKPVRVELDIVSYADGKRKFLESAWYKNGALEFKKRRVACVTKNGRLLSGRLPEGYNMDGSKKKAAPTAA